MAGTAAGSEHFARHLRELKDRSGLSYGQLATRLHVGTSTLHRYCNGDAVPADYAVVERLARLCGAGPEELVELHRRWVLADAVRRVGNRGGGAVPERDGGGNGNGSGSDDAAPAGSAASGPVPEPEPASVPATAAVDPAPELAPIGPAPGGPRPSRPWRRRLSRPAVAGSVAALVLTGAVLAMTDGATGERPPAHAASPRSAQPGDAGGPPTPADGTGPRSPTASASGPPSGKPSATGTDGTPRSPGGGATASGAPVPARPLVWSVRSHVWQSGCDHRYLIARPPSDVPPPPVAQDAPAWAGALGAVHGGTTIVEATVQGRGSTPVVVQALHIRVVERRSPLRWSSYAMSNGCGGALTPAEYAVDLDAARPEPHSQDGFDGENVLPAVRLPYQVSERDPLVLRVTARTVRCDCDWYLELEWTAGNRTKTVRIGDDGRPFRTSGVKGRPEYGYLPETGWTRD